MPETEIVLFVDSNGNVPLLDWLDTLSRKARAKCLARLERLAKMGHELRRPEADFLRDGIHELQASLQGQNYRILYFFHGNRVAVVSHGLVKERVVPSKEIDLAIKRKLLFERAPMKHTYRQELDHGKG